MQLRDYQIEAVNSLPHYFQRKSGNPLIAMPTGTGKSVVIAGFLQLVFQYPNQRVIIATHVKELIQQNYDKLMTLWPQAPAGIYSAGLGRKDRFNPITFAGIKSIVKKAADFGVVDILIIDEAHLVSPSDETSYQKFVKDLKKANPNLKVIGLTATPWRLGHGLITENGGLFTDICFDITGMHAFNRLLEEGYLSPLIPKNPRMLLDVEGVGTQNGDYKQRELQLSVDKSEITSAALKEAIEFGHDRHSWLLFCSGVEHSIHVAEMLTALGIPCKAVHSDMPEKERDDTIADWKAGRLRAIANNNVMTTGVDHPLLDFIGVLRPTKSTTLWVQMLGRGTRPFYVEGYDLTTIQGRLASIEAGPKQNCLVMDFAGNTKRLGPVNDPVIPHKKGSGGGVAPVKLCMSCSTWNHASARFCVHCHTEFLLGGPKIVDSADTNALIKQDNPIVEVFSVDQITYMKHEKEGRPPSLKLNYYCGLRSFHEFVPLELQGAGRGIAQRWWNQRFKNSSYPMPATVDEVLANATRIPPATHIRVWTNKKYPEILATCFDGTCFGQTEPVHKPVQVVAVPPSDNPWKKQNEAQLARIEARY